MKLLVIDAPGLLYLDGQSPPVADPIPVGIDIVRRVMEGYGSSAMVVHHGDADPVELRSWLSVYKITPTWVLSEPTRTTTEDFVQKVILREVGKVQGTLALFVTANSEHARFMQMKSITSLMMMRAEDGVPDWKARGSSWSNEAVS